MATTSAEPQKKKGFLNAVERFGNTMPSVTMLFVYALMICWVLSFLLSFVDFNYFLPAQVAGEAPKKIEVINMFNYNEIVTFIISSVNNFMSFPPLGITIVATFGIGIAEKSGFVKTALKKLLGLISPKFLTPTVVLVSIIAHLVSDSAYVILMPVAALMFYAMGRHPLAGVATAFAGLAGGFSASFTPSKIDPIMQGFTQKAAHIMDPSYVVNVLCNYFLSLGSTIGVIAMCWYVTEKIVEPWLNKNCPVDQQLSDDEANELSVIQPIENKGFKWAGLSVLALIVLLVVLLIPEQSPMRAPDGSMTSSQAGIMKMIVPLIFMFFAIPGMIYGYITGSFKSSKDVIGAMEEITKSLIPFIVFAFFAAQFLYSFDHSNIGKLIALAGADALTTLKIPSEMTIFLVIVLVGLVNILITSATSKWAIMAPVLVPMLMAVGISPELTQAAFRISDSAVNVSTPMFPFYPLIIMYCCRYYSKTGVGTLCSMMLPYTVGLFIVLTATLYIFWWLNIPLGFESTYTIPVINSVAP